MTLPAWPCCTLPCPSLPCPALPCPALPCLPQLAYHTYVYIVDHVLPTVCVSSMVSVQMSAASAALSLLILILQLPADMTWCDVLQSNFHRVRAPNPGEYQKQRCSIVSSLILCPVLGADPVWYLANPNWICATVSMLFACDACAAH